MLYGPNSVNFRTAVGILVNGSNPYNGVCYSYAGTAVPCYNSSGSSFGAGVGAFTLQQAAGMGNGVVYPAAGVTCGGGPCQRRSPRPSPSSARMPPRT